MRDKQQHSYKPCWRIAVTAIVCAFVLSACGGSKEKKPGQSLVRVNDDDITVLQLNEELQRSGVPANQQEATSKKILESLIDRQLLQSEAIKEKLDRDPKVLQAIERAKSLILAQSYLQKRVGEPGKPSAGMVEEYFNKHPELFVQRKQLEMRQLIFATQDLGDSLKSEIDSAKTLDDVAAWMDAHKVRVARNQISRSSVELPQELVAKLLTMQKGQLFIVKEGERTIVSTIVDIKDTPVTLVAATPQIEQYLVGKKNKDAADAEIARLRAAAKIEYLNKQFSSDASTVPGSIAPSEKNPAVTTSESNERGVAGLK